MALIPPIRGRAAVAYAHDIVMAALSCMLSLYLRLGDGMFFYSRGIVVEGTAVFTAIAAGVFLFMGLYRGLWRYASLSDLVAITRAVSLTVLLFLMFMFLWTRLEDLPRSLVVINWFVLMALLGGPRFLYRLAKDRRFAWREAGDGRARVPILLVGAGDRTELFIRALARTPDANYRVLGIVADRSNQIGSHIHGIEVMGAIDDLDHVVRTLATKGERPQRLVLTKDEVDGAKVRALFDKAAALGMTLARLPKLTELQSGISDKVEVKPVAFEDLLGRPQTPLDRSAMRGLIEGRRVLVTGAGGSIGSELVRQVCDFDPSELILVDNGEFNLYSIDLEAAEGYPDLKRRAVLLDVRDRERVTRLIREVRPELVFHAAALKHVPLVEANPVEGVMTNAIGTVNVADACIAANVAAMVLISTDKAVNPTSVMGASKRIAESYCQALDVTRGSATRFVTVRFGNVLGSTGSVVPLFQKQLAAGGPLTLTHPDMTRYFMTVREAVELVLQASALGIQGPAQEGMIFVLDMGEPVRIMNLAQQMIQLAGLKPDIDIKIEIVGPRPGEKLAEEIFHSGENLVPTACAGILLAAPRAGKLDDVSARLAEISAACARNDTAAVLGLIQRLVPEYRGPAAAPQAATA